MKRFSFLLSVLMVLTLVLAACGGEAATTAPATTVPAPTEAAAAPQTPA